MICSDSGTNGLQGKSNGCFVFTKIVREFCFFEKAFYEVLNFSEHYAVAGI